MGRAIRVLVLASLAAAIGAVACVETLPHLTCSVADVQALPSDQFPAASSSDCTSCLETPCCDVIGNCDDKCRAKVKAAHACMLATGRYVEARAEQGCLVKNGVTPEADIAAYNAYECMHDTCGEACVVPSCKVDRSYGLLVNANCDNCMAGSCCAELNACAADRGCKLITDCILSRCNSLFGPGTASLPLDVVQAFANAACTNTPSSQGPPACVQECLNELVPTGDAAVVTTSDPQRSSACIGLKIVACGVASGCNQQCDASDAGRD